MSAKSQIDSFHSFMDSDVTSVCVFNIDMEIGLDAVDESSY